MRLFYLDPGLTTLSGHHAAHCRLITREFRSRGFEIEVFGYVDADAAVTAELQAQPHFRHSTYVLTDGDPLCGWLSGFDRFTRTTVEDLMRLDEIAPTDLVYLSSARAIELSAITAWMAMRAGTMPSVVADFSIPAGIESERTEAALKIR